MNCLIPIKHFVKVKTTTKDADGKDQTKIQQKQLIGYGHSTWLEEENEQKIIEIFKKQVYKTRFVGVATGIASFIAIKNIPFLSKLRWEYKLGGVFAPALLAYFAAGYIFSKTDLGRINKILLENDLIPIWKDKSRVIEKNKVYFHLDDDKGFAPNVLYHGISERQVDNIFPDATFGNKNFQKHFGKTRELIYNDDPARTNQILQQLSFKPRTKREAAHH